MVCWGFVGVDWGGGSGGVFVKEGGWLVLLRVLLLMGGGRTGRFFLNMKDGVCID